MNKIFMLLLVLVIQVFALSGCSSEVDGCIQSYLDEGYDYSDAKDMCEDAYWGYY
jgi:hypothetical protein